jgi:hypothetical protein
MMEIGAAVTSAFIRNMCAQRLWPSCTGPSLSRNTQGRPLNPMRDLGRGEVMHIETKTAWFEFQSTISENCTAREARDFARAKAMEGRNERRLVKQDLTRVDNQARMSIQLCDCETQRDVVTGADGRSDAGRANKIVTVHGTTSGSG